MILTIEETFSNDIFIIDSSKNNVIACIPVHTHLHGVVYDRATTIYT
jgi:YVTN family beta-propeller protein